MNKLNTKARLRILMCLLEGNSIRSTARIVGVSKVTILKLLTEAGTACLDYQKDTLKQLQCKNVQLDEIWSFVYSKKKSSKQVSGKGDSWTWVAFCPETKLIPCWYVGDRTTASADEFIRDLSTRIVGKTQISSDGLKSYRSAIYKYMPESHFAMLVKHYIKNKNGGDLVMYKEIIQGTPDIDSISTSHVERQNLNIRMSIRRFTRKTNAFSKKIENHKAALSLYFYYYNFIRKHRSLKTTPANKMGVCGEKKLESILKLVG